MNFLIHLLNQIIIKSVIGQNLYHQCRAFLNIVYIWTLFCSLIKDRFLHKRKLYLIIVYLVHRNKKQRPRSPRSVTGIFQLWKLSTSQDEVCRLLAHMKLHMDLQTGEQAHQMQVKAIRSTNSLSWCSTAVIKHHGQGSLKKETLNWGLVCSFRGFVNDHYIGEHGSREAGMALEQ